VAPGSDENPIWLPAATRYVDALSSSLDSTREAGDRARYQEHLAQAARLVSILDRGAEEQLAKWIDAEEHSYGWSYLAGDEGDAAERAFVELVTALRTAGS
jgi:hypothetical protein